MTFNLCFYPQLWIKWVYIHIGNSSVQSGCLTRKEMRIKLASLIISSINGNLSNTSSTPPLYTEHLKILCASAETPIYRKFKDKIFTLL